MKFCSLRNGGYFTLFASAAALPIVASKFLIDSASELFNIRKILAAAANTVITMDGKAVNASFGMDADAPVFSVYIRENFTLGDFFSRVQVSEQMDDYLAQISDVCVKGVWALGIGMALSLAGSVAYKWYYPGHNHPDASRRDSSVETGDFEDDNDIDLGRDSQRAAYGRRCC